MDRFIDWFSGAQFSAIHCDSPQSLLSERLSAIRSDISGTQSLQNLITFCTSLDSQGSLGSLTAFNISVTKSGLILRNVFCIEMHCNVSSTHIIDAFLSVPLYRLYSSAVASRQQIIMCRLMAF